MAAVNQETEARIEAEVEQYRASRTAEWSALTREAVYNAAQGYSLAGLSAETKAVIVKAIVDHEASAHKRSLRYEAAQVEAKALGFNDSSERYTFETEMEKLRKLIASDVTAAVIDKVQAHEDPARRASAMLYEYRWGNPVEACLQVEFAVQLVGFVERTMNEHTDEETGEVTPPKFTNGYEALQTAKYHHLERPLVENYWTGGSSSAWHNAVEAARRDVASSMLRRIY